ncbi:MAG: hypothetical protein K9M99_02885 [Candidatus Cloacimonetes bacterium]|nr:hypothetical protein [Candidatus Cloacimonadota bacterium]
MLMLFKKKLYKNLAFASWVLCVILLILKIMNYENLMSPESPLIMFIIVEAIFFISGLWLIFESKKM